MNPESAPALRAAEVALGQGRKSEAKGLLTALLLRDPAAHAAHFLLGVVAGESGDVATAVRHLKACVSGEPRHPWALFHLVRIHRASGQSVEAIHYATQLEPVAEDGMLMEAGMAFFDARRFAEATRCFENAARQPQLETAAQFWTALCMRELGRPSEARRMLRQAAPAARQAEPYYRLADVELFFGETAACKDACRDALRCDPRSHPARLLLARALSAEGGGGEADLAWAEAERTAVRPDEVLVQRGHVLQSSGDFAGAESAFRRAIASNPRGGNAYALLFHTRLVTESDAELVGQATRLVGSGVDATSERHFHFALGKANHDSGEFSSANDHYAKANALTEQVVFGGARPPDHQGEFHNGAVELLTADRLADLASRGNPSETPVFVLGMLRSGTTLFEHILSSHPVVTGAGELGFWQVNRGEMVDFANGVVREDRLQAGAAEYLETLDALARGSRRVTDKNPANYSSAGLIHAAFPNARIVCMRRKPIDIALSLWMTNMATRAPYVGDKARIVAAIREMERVTDHWAAVIPADRFKVVWYEEVVAERDRVTREAVEFLGLDWDDACLNPQTNRREVLTPSFWQVRQPVYTSSIDRWRPYQQWLGEFEELLEERPRA